MPAWSSAWLPAAYPDRSLDHAALRPFRAMVERMLAAHEPFPAFAIDRWWSVLQANNPAQCLFGRVGSDVDIIELLLGPMRQQIENWPSVAWASVDRLRRELAHSGGDTRLAEMLRRAEHHLAATPRPTADEHATVICPRIRVGDTTIETVGTILSFGTPREVILDETRVELLFPANDRSERCFRELERTSTAVPT